MVKDCHQLWLSLRIGCGLVVATLAAGPGVNSLLAGGDEPAIAYRHHAYGVAESFAHGDVPRSDTSCEPSFRGGNCEDCCLDLWRGYCGERKCCHTHSFRHFGVGCLGFGCLLGNHHCETVISSSAPARCSCHASPAPVTVAEPQVEAQPQVIDEAGTQNAAVSLDPQSTLGDSYETQPTVEVTEPTDVVPPSNPLPPSPTPFEIDPSEEKPEESEPAAAKVPPGPPSIDFSVEPAASARTPFTTVSTKQNAGTARLLKQLRAN